MKDFETNYQKELLVISGDSETKHDLLRLSELQRLKAQRLKAQRKLNILKTETLSRSECSRYTNEHSDIQDGLGTGGNFDIYTGVSTTERESRKYDV